MVVRYGAAARLLHCGGEPAPSCGRSANPRLVSPPAPQACGFPGAGTKGRALSCSAASAALRSAFAAPGTYGFQRPTLLATPCFPSQLREPARLACGPAFVSLRLLRNRYAFPCLSPGRPRPSRLLPASRLRRLALAPRSPAASLGLRLARRRSPRAFFLSFPQNREPAPHMSFPRKRESIGSVLTPFVLPAKSGNAPYLSFPRKRESRKIM